MIPVKPQPEPPDFDRKVRQPGREWLRNKGIALNAAPLDPAKLPTYWRECLPDLWKNYDGVCAYLAIYFEYCTGSATTDHFIAKSKSAEHAYEWSNFRLSTLGSNRNKNKAENALC